MSEFRNDSPEERKKRGFLSRTAHDLLDPIRHGIARAASRIPLIGPALIAVGHIFADILTLLLKSVSWVVVGTGSHIIKKSGQVADQWKQDIAEKNAEKGKTDFEPEADLIDIPDADVLRGDDQPQAEEQNPEENLQAAEENPQAAEANPQPQDNPPAEEEEIPDFDDLLEEALPEAENAQPQNAAAQNGNANENGNNAPGLENHVVPDENIFKMDAKDVYAAKEEEPLQQLVKSLDREKEDDSVTRWADRIIKGANNSKSYYMDSGDWGDITKIMYYRALDHRMRKYRYDHNGKQGGIEKMLRKSRGKDLLEMSGAVKETIKKALEKEAASNKNLDNMKELLNGYNSSKFHELEISVLKTLKAELTKKKNDRLAEQRNRGAVQNGRQNPHLEERNLENQVPGA